MCGSSDNDGYPQPCPGPHAPSRGRNHRISGRTPYPPRPPSYTTLPPGNPAKPLNEWNIREALKHAASFLHCKDLDFTIAAGGEVASTLLLQVKIVASDLQFFGDHLDTAQMNSVSEAMEYGEQMSNVPLKTAWADKGYFLQVNPDFHRSIMKEALQINKVVFEEPGLKVVAMPFSHMFIYKASKVGTENESPADLDDLICYLHHRNIEVQVVTVHLKFVEDTCTNYGKKMLHEGTTHKMNEKYRARHGCNLIFKPRQG